MELLALVTHSLVVLKVYTFVLMSLLTSASNPLLRPLTSTLYAK